MAATARRMPASMRVTRMPEWMATAGWPSSIHVSKDHPSGWFRTRGGNMSRNVSMAMCRNGALASRWISRAVELLPTLLTPFSTTTRPSMRYAVAA